MTLTSSAQNDASPEKKIVIKAKPESITMDANKTALIVVDMQNDFCTNGAMMDRAGIDISMIQNIVPVISNVIAAARKACIKIIYLKMGFSPDLSDLGEPNSPNQRDHAHFHVGDTMRAPNGTQSRLLIRDTWNTDIITELKPQVGDIIINKHRFSGFYETDLDATLKRLGIKNLIITGCTTSVCVESTVRDAMFRDYSPVVLNDCTAEPIGYGLTRSNHDASLFLMQTLFGWVSSSDEFIKAVTPQLSAALQ